MAQPPQHTGVSPLPAWLDGRAAGTRAAPGGRLLTVGAFLLALLVSAQYGFTGSLVPDSAVLLYAGQRMAEGVPPYVSAATLKGPLAQVVLGAGIAAGRVAGWDDVLTARVLFWLVSALTVALVARLGADLWRSPRAGLFAALVMTGCVGYARHAASGPRYHTLMLLFFVLGLLLTVRKRWFGAGAAGALAYLVWQPSILLLATTLLLAACEQGRRRALAATAAGAVLPLAAVFAWGLAAGIGGELATRLLLFSLPLATAREPQSLASHLTRPVRAILAGYGPWMLVATPAALAVFLDAFRRELGRQGSWQGALRSGGPTAVACVFLLMGLWSLFDFQGYDDFFPLLPPVALGCGLLLARLVAALDGGRVTATAGSRLAGVAVAGALLFWSFTSVRAAGERGLAAQRGAARELDRLCGEGCRLVSVGDPAPLVLLRRANPGPFVQLYDWTQGLIERRVPGGLAAWLDSLGSGERLVVVGPVPHGPGQTILRNRLRDGFRRERVGPLVLFVREPAR